MNNILFKINKLLEDRKVKKTDLSKNMKCSRATVYNYLDGKSPLTVDFLIDVCNYFNVPMSYFFNDKPATGGNSVQIGHNNVAGNVSGSNNNINYSADQCRHELEMLRELLQAKEHIIELLNEQIKGLRKK